MNTIMAPPSSSSTGFMMFDPIYNTSNPGYIDARSASASYSDTTQHKMVFDHTSSFDVGDRLVPRTHEGMDTLEYKQFEGSSDTYLATVSMNILLVSSVIAIMTHFAMVISDQREFSYNTFMDILQGPLLLVVIAGLTGVGLVFGYYGVSADLYYSLYIPFGLIILGVGVWSIISQSEVDRFGLGNISGVIEMAPEVIIWMFIVVSVVVTSIVQWSRGKMRLDAMGPFSYSMMVFVFLVVLFTVGLSYVFALVIKTISHFETGKGNGGRDSPEFFIAYVAASIAVMVLVVSSVKFLDTCITLFGGHLGTIYSPGSGVGATKAVVETQRAYKLAIYSVVFIAAALMWRRRRGLVDTDADGHAKESTGDSIQTEWMSLGVIVLLLPGIALISEMFKNWALIYNPLYDLLRALVFSCILVFVGTGYVPWNFTTLGICGLVALSVILGYPDIKEEWDKPLAAFICACVFVMGKLMYRAGETWFRAKSFNAAKSIKEDGPPRTTSTSTSVWLWVANIVIPALVLTVFGYVSDEVMAMPSPSGEKHKVSYSPQLFKLYLAFTLFYSMTLVFVDTTSQMPISDSPDYDMIPDNEAASLAIDGLILMACLMSSMALWNVIVPREIQSLHPDMILGGDIDVTFRGYKMAKVSVLTILGFIVTGMGCTYMYINARHDRDMSNFARKSQEKTEEWYLNTMKDSVW